LLLGPSVFTFLPVGRFTNRTKIKLQNKLEIIKRIYSICKLYLDIVDWELVLV
jgi:hypothetical protein